MDRQTDGRTDGADGRLTIAIPRFALRASRGNITTISEACQPLWAYLAIAGSPMDIGRPTSLASRPINRVVRRAHVA